MERKWAWTSLEWKKGMEWKMVRGLWRGGGVVRMVCGGLWRGGG